MGPALLRDLRPILCEAGLIEAFGPGDIKEAILETYATSVFYVKLIGYPDGSITKAYTNVV